MGASTFFTTATGPLATAAFQQAREEAAFEFGHGGYTGTVAEKDSYTVFDEPRRSASYALDRAEELINADDPRINDKWGPAGALPISAESGDGWMFFGWASC